MWLTHMTLAKPPIASAPLWLRDSNMVLYVTEISEERTPAPQIHPGEPKGEESPRARSLRVCLGRDPSVTRP